MGSGGWMPFWWRRALTNGSEEGGEGIPVRVEAALQHADAHLPVPSMLQVGTSTLPKPPSPTSLPHRGRSTEPGEGGSGACPCPPLDLQLNFVKPYVSNR